MLAKLLSDGEDELLREERKTLSRLRAALVRFNAAPEHQSALDRSIEQLDELFLLVIVGEFNSGKSAFINALVGATVAQEGVTPTTAQINVLQYGETTSRTVRESNLHVITAPAPILRDGIARHVWSPSLCPMRAGRWMTHSSSTSCAHTRR